MAAPCGRAAWPHAPARPGPRPWLWVLWASFKQRPRPPLPLGPGVARALLATLEPGAANWHMEPRWRSVPAPRAGHLRQRSRDEALLRDSVASWKGLKLAGRSLCSQASSGMASPHTQVLGAELQPGRAGSALRLRNAGTKSPGGQPKRRFEKVGLCPRLSAFAEPWPRWA